MKVGDPVQVNFPLSIAQATDTWVNAIVDQVNGGSIAVVPAQRNAVFPNGYRRITLTFPANHQLWRY